MAIFGSLTEMPLPDVLPTLARRTGRFTVWNTSSQHYYELHLDQGQLTGFMVDNEPVEDVFPLRNRMTELMNLTSGEFEFENLAARLLLTHHQLTIDTLLLSGLSVLNEVASNRSQLPNVHTVFQTRTAKEPWLTGDLLDFWQCSSRLLAEGASAEKIATHTALFTDQVRLYLYKLRMAGVIGPVRAFQFGADTSPASSGFPFMSSNSDFDQHFQHTGLPVGDPGEGQPPAPKTGLLRRLIAHLRNGFSGQS